MNHNQALTHLTLFPIPENVTGKKRTTLADFVRYPLEFITSTSMPRNPLNPAVYLPVKSPSDYSPVHLKAVVTHIRDSLAGEIDKSRAFAWLATVSVVASPAPPPNLLPHDKVASSKAKPQPRRRDTTTAEASNRSANGEEGPTNVPTVKASDKSAGCKEAPTQPLVVIRYLDPPPSPDPRVSSCMFSLHRQQQLTST